MFNLKQIAQMRTQLEERMKKIQESLKDMRLDGTSGGGAVKVVCNGKSELISLEIAKEAIDPNDPETLQDLIIAAVNQAVDKARVEHENALSQATGGIKLPGIFG